MLLFKISLEKDDQSLKVCWFFVFASGYIEKCYDKIIILVDVLFLTSYVIGQILEFFYDFLFDFEKKCNIV